MLDWVTSINSPLEDQSAACAGTVDVEEPPLVSMVAALVTGLDLSLLILGRIAATLPDGKQRFLALAGQDKVMQAVEQSDLAVRALSMAAELRG